MNSIWKCFGWALLLPGLVLADVGEFRVSSTVGFSYFSGMEQISTAENDGVLVGFTASYQPNSHMAVGLRLNRIFIGLDGSGYALAARATGVGEFGIMRLSFGPEIGGFTMERNTIPAVHHTAFTVGIYSAIEIKIAEAVLLGSELSYQKAIGSANRLGLTQIAMTLGTVF